MPESITIQGETFTVNPPYVAGHVLKENEASSLNQTWAENIRNNFATKVKAGTEAGIGKHVLQQQLDEYASKYEFGVRTGGGRTTDPVEQEARAEAKKTVIEKLKIAGHDPAKYTQAAISDAALRLLEHETHGPRIRAKAAANVEERKVAAAEDISDIMPVAEEEEAA